MMQAKKDYIAKGAPEYESPQVKYLWDLLRSVKAQAAPTEIEDPAKIEVEPVKSVNKDKPTLKLTK